MPPLTSENSYFLRSGPQGATLVMLTIRDTRVCYESNTTIRESNSTNTFAQPLLTIASLSSQIQIQDGDDRTRTR